MPDPAGQDACELLDADHLAVKHLFVEYARMAFTPDADPAATRGAIALRICDELEVHAQIEEEIFYPALRSAVPDVADVLDEARQEHQEARELVAQIRELGDDAGDEIDVLVAQLNRAVEHHVKEERDELFPKARSAGLDLVALAGQLRDRQNELQAAQPAG
jgi:hypothetical protein